MASISSAWTLGRSPWRSPASRMVRDSSAVNTPVSQNTSQNSANPSRAARGIISWHSRRMYASRRPRYSSGRAWAPINVAASSTGCVSFSRRMTRSCFISCSGSRPYPLFASQVVTPIRSISARASAAFCASCSSVAARVARTVERMPPPWARISRYGTPRSFCPSSFCRHPPKIRCVWASTSPGVTSRPPASMTRSPSAGAGVPCPTAATVSPCSSTQAFRSSVTSPCCVPRRAEWPRGVASRPMFVM